MFGCDFFCRQLLNKEGPASEVDTAVLKDEQLASPAAYRLWAHSHTGVEARAGESFRPGGHRARRCAPSLQNFMMFHRLRIPVPPLWREGAWQTFFAAGRRAGGVACRSLCRGSHTLCVAITHPGKTRTAGSVGHGCAAHSSWGMQSAFAKTRPGYDAETALFNAAAVIGGRSLRPGCRSADRRCCALSG